VSWIDTMGIALRHQLTSLDKKIIRNANRTERRKLLCYERKPLAIKALKWPEANSLLTAQIRNVKQINGTGRAWKKIIETLRLVDELIIYNRNVCLARIGDITGWVSFVSNRPPLTILISWSCQHTWSGVQVSDRFRRNCKAVCLALTHPSQSFRAAPLNMGRCRVFLTMDILFFFWDWSFFTRP